MKLYRLPTVGGGSEYAVLAAPPAGERVVCTATGRQFVRLPDGRWSWDYEVPCPPPWDWRSALVRTPESVRFWSAQDYGGPTGEGPWEVIGLSVPRGTEPEAGSVLRFYWTGSPVHYEDDPEADCGPGYTTVRYGGVSKFPALPSWEEGSTQTFRGRTVHVLSRRFWPGSASSLGRLEVLGVYC